MGGKDKGGREVRKPKADAKKKGTGQPTAGAPALDSIRQAPRPGAK